MKTLILSDIHSNIYALEAIWAQERDTDLIYCAGDLVDYGPYPKEALSWVRSHDVACVQGNHDRRVVKYYRSGNTLESIPFEERAWVHHNVNLLEEHEIEYLEQLPQTITFELDEITYGMTHLYQDYEEIVSLHAYKQFLEQTADTANACITRLIFGHTHRQAVHYLSNRLLWLNPGSVSYRRRDDPDQTTHYATITDGTILLKRLPYDIEPLRMYVSQVSLKDSEIDVAERFFGLREDSFALIRE